MADFTLPAPGTTNTPWAPANVIVPVSTIKSDATGFRATTAGVLAAFAHDANYGPVIDSTLTVVSGASSNGDDAVNGALVRSGANAGAIIGMYQGTIHIQLVSVDKTGSVTTISNSITIARANTDVFDCSVSISGGTATLTGKYNGTTQSFTGTTTTAFATEPSLAAGAQIAPNNSNLLYFSQFTGTGVAAAAQVPFMPYAFQPMVAQ